jgi:hypothetical protein
MMSTMSGRSYNLDGSAITFAMLFARKPSESDFSHREFYLTAFALLSR